MVAAQSSSHRRALGSPRYHREDFQAMNEGTYVEGVLQKAEALKRVGFWLPEPHVRPRAWLTNFQPTEQIAAAAILDNLLYYSDTMMNALLRATHRSLIDLLQASSVDLNDAIFTRIEDETPNPTDSGNIFCRKARYHLGIPEERLVEPADALQIVIASGCTLVLLDDFMGSSNQLVSTWTRPYQSGSTKSFEEAFKARPFNAHYIPLVTTSRGLETASYLCPGITVTAGHVLGDEYSVRRVAELPSSPPVSDLADRIHHLLANYANRFELRNHMKQSDFALYGYDSFGLTVAFQHGCPDASIPLIWAKAPGWTPLVNPS